ncbi:MAG: FtsX-like permease family protein, partial [Bacteroidota bacterium]
QFFGESFLTAFISMLLAFGIIAILLPYFNQLAGKSFTLTSLARPDIVAIIIATVLLVALFSGIYPALYLSGFKPITVLRNKFAPGKGPEVFRRALVVFQFTISVILIICTSVVYLQMNMIRSSKLSEAGEQIVSIRFGGNAPANKYNVYRQSLMRDLDLQQVSMGNHLPRQEYFGNINTEMRFPGLNENEYDWSLINVEYNFPEMFGLEMVAGRSFENRIITDSSTVAPFIMNEAAVRTLGLENEKALSTSVNIPMGEGSMLTGQIIGIVKDFPYRSMRTAIEPMLMTTFPSQLDKIVYVRLPKDKVEEKLTYLETTWKEVIPGVGFDYWFLDEEFDRMYANESRMADLTEVFSLLAILIACLGVYGLASYLAERKTKEIGIRKILGASVQQILGLLSKTFVVILMLSSVIAVPVAYFLMQDWLQNFVYRIGIGWWILVASVAAIFILTAITVSFETIKAARLNPVDYLRED